MDKPNRYEPSCDIVGALKLIKTPVIKRDKIRLSELPSAKANGLLGQYHHCDKFIQANP